MDVPPALTIRLASLLVEDPEAAERFYTSRLGFRVSRVVDVGPGVQWRSLVPPGGGDGPELVLQPAGSTAARAYVASQYRAGVAAVAFAVDDLDAAVDALTARGVQFVEGPTDTPEARIAIFDDTCGHLVQLYAPKDQS